MTTRVFLAGYPRLVCEGLTSLLAHEPDIQVVGFAGEGQAALRLMAKLTTDVLVADPAMPGLNGNEVIARASARQPALRALCLSQHGDAESVRRAIDAGAHGYVVKEASCGELALAIRKVGSRLTHFSDTLGLPLVDRARLLAGRLGGAPVDGPRLTRREREVVQLLSEGLTTQQIADRLYLSAKTIATHRENVLRKLDLGGIAQLTRYALREGLSSLEVACPAGRLRAQRQRG